MLSRIYAVAFVTIVVLGVFYQHDYMRISAAEVRIIEERMRRNTVLLGASDFVFDRYDAGRRSDRIEGATGHIMTDGSLELKGRLWVTQFGANGPTKINTELATGRMVLSQGSNRPRLSEGSSDGSSSNLQVLQLPEDVKMYLPDGIIQTSRVTLSFVGQLLQTESPVAYFGTGKNLRGRGLLFRLNDGTFELGGPVSGRLEPARARPQ